MALPCCAVTPVCRSCCLYSGYHAAGTGLQPQHLSGIPCNSSFLIPCTNYRSFYQQFIRIHLLHTYRLHRFTMSFTQSLNTSLLPRQHHWVVYWQCPSSSVRGLLSSLPYLRRAHTAVWQNGGFSAKFKFSSSIELLCKTEHLYLDFRHFAKLQNVSRHPIEHSLQIHANTFHTRHHQN